VEEDDEDEQGIAPMGLRTESASAHGIDELLEEDEDVEHAACSPRHSLLRVTQ
jgi:hypothetical protein